MRRYCSRIVWAAVVLGLASVLALPAAAGPNVLLLWDDDQSSVSNSPPLPSELNAKTQAFIAALEAAGLRVTLADKTQALYTGLNPAPTAFDAVIHLNGNTTSTIDVMIPSAVVNLLSYVENDAGGFVTSENTEAQIEIPFVGLTAVMEDLMLLDRGVGAPPAFGTMSLSPVVGQESHPLLTGLTPPIAFEGGRMVSTVRSYGTDPATVILQDEAGYDAAAVRALGAGRVVSFHHTGNFQSTGNLSDTLTDPEAQRLFINAVLWSDQRVPTATISLEAPRANASGAAFLVTFSEGVDGFDASDLDLIVGGALGGSPSFSITPQSDRLFRVLVTGYSGVGTLQLNLLDDDSIVDQSFNDNPLGGTGTGATLMGPVLPADTIAPNVDDFTANPFVVPVGETGELTITFDEAMDQTYPPLLNITTAGGDIITASPQTPPPSDRVETGLLALYPFNEGAGSTVHDTSGVGTALDLGIAAPANTHWLEGALSIDSSTILLSSTGAAKITNACKVTNEVSIEAWVRPANATQTGPARIASVGTATARNVTLEQDAAAYETRVRTTSTGSNGDEVSAPAQVNAGTLQHVVFTRDSSGTARIYVDNVLAVSTSVAGDFSGWNNTYRLALGNELNQAFPWRGEFHLVAVYDRALSGSDVQQNFDAGPVTVTPGNGVWLNPFTYRVSLDRAVTAGDAGTAQVAIVGARDLAGNDLVPQATRPLGMISSTLVVEQEPAAEYVREAGEPFEFSVTVSGAVGGLDYAWFKEDDSKVFLPVGGNAPVLSFPALAVDDSGTYYCVITDIQASVQTNPSHLEVFAALPVGGLLGLIASASALALIGVVATRRRA